MIVQMPWFFPDRRVAALALTVSLLAFSPASADSWQAEPLTVPGGKVREIRQDDERVFVHVGGRWREIATCAEHRLCFTPRNPPRQRKAPAAGLPDGKVAIRAARSGPVRAWYEQPTTTYSHAILGDGVEATRLVAETAAGKRMSISAGKDQVFEDITPRLADLDGDGRNEVVAIRSDIRKGAAIAVYGTPGGSLELLAATPAIGLANRWRNPSLFVENPNGRGKLIGEVVTPHIGGTLKLWELAGSAQSGYRLEPRGSARGFSNHAIGSRLLGLSAARGRILAVPSANRRSLRIIRARAGTLESIATVDVGGRINHAIGIISESGNPLFLVGLADDQLVLVGQRDAVK